MIGLRDSATLARTKIRSKRVRLLITTIVSGLLFGLLGSGILLLGGVGDSVDRFAQQNLGGRYLVQGMPAIPMEMEYLAPEDPKAVAEVKALHAAYVAERKAAAKKYDITDYDEKSEVPPVVDNPYGDPSLPADQRVMANTSSVAWQRHEAATMARTRDKITATPEQFADLARTAGATETFRPRSLQHLGLAYLADGREDLTAAQTPAEDGVEGQEGSSITSSGFTVMDDALVDSFVLEPNTARSTPRGVPVLVPIDDVTRTLGKTLALPTRPKDSAAQLRWYREVQDLVNGRTFTTCYRNEAERARLEDARRIATELAAHEADASQPEPKIVLSLPTTPCGSVTVASDTRSAREKQADENREAFEAVGRTEPLEKPRAELVTFQIVGVLPSVGDQSGGLESLVQGIVGTTYGFGSLVPAGLLADVPAEHRHTALFESAPTMSPNPMMGFDPGAQDTSIASFPSVERAKAFLTTNTCDGGSGGMFGGGYYVECGKPFSVGTYGTSYLVVDDISRALRPYLIGLLAVLFGIATVIIWAMMGRVIADSRRETAVFRALGAKRSDIIGVYLLYSLWVALRIVLFAAALGAVVVLAIELVYAQRATNAAQLAYGVFDGDARFHFLGIPTPLFWALLGGILAMSLVAITPPLLRNIRRNPIRDMRDE